MSVINYDDIKGKNNKNSGALDYNSLFNIKNQNTSKITTTIQNKKKKNNILNTVASSAGMLATEVTKAAGSVYEGIADTGAAILKQAGKLSSKAVDNKVGKFIFGNDAGNYENNPLYQIGESMTNDNVVETIAKPLEDKFEENSIIKKDGLVSNVAQGVGQVMALSSNPLGIGETSLNLGSKTLPIASGTKTMFMSTLGNSFTKAKQEGADDNEAMLYGLLSAGKETASEAMYGGLGKAFGKGALDDVVKSKAISMIKSKVGQKAAELGIGMTAEGLEEVASSIFEPFIQRVYKDKENIEPNTFNSLLSDFVGGALVSGVMQGTEGAINFGTNKINKNVLPKASDNIKNNSLSNNTNINSENNYQYQKSDNIKIDNLRKSASQYFNNSSETNNLINTYEKIISDKGYNVLFDNNITNNNGILVDAKITPLKNGEVEIRINPNSQKAGEFLIMHEVTHSIGTSEMKNLVMDYANKNPDFNNALESLKNTYGTSDVSDEVLSDISGQLFGNQEFINELSTKEPSLFRKIYNKIIEFANKLTGNSKESLFIKDLKNKWEDAYRTQNNNLDDTQYMMTSTKGMENGLNTNERYFDIKKRYNNALNLEKNEAYTNEDIRQQTGWFKDKYGNWEFEISDRNTEFKKIPVINKKYQLSEIFNAKTLYEMYPNLQNVNISFKKMNGNGKFNFDNNIIDINENLLNNLDDARGTILHEIQHYIQHFEKLPFGTTIKFGNERYANSKGEIEAADTKNRKDLTVEQRKQLAPESSKEQPTHPNRESILNHKRNTIEKISEKLYNIFGDDAHEVFEENIVSNNKNSSQSLVETSIKNSRIKGLNTNSSFILKQKQLDAINKSNPAPDEIHTWIRNIDDIKTFDEAFFEDGEYSGFDPDFTEKMAKQAQDTGKVMVYSSYPIENGIFVSPSKLEASQYASGDTSKLYSREVDIKDVAWIDGAEGQYAKINNNSYYLPKYSQTNKTWQEHLNENYKSTGTKTNLSSIKQTFPTSKTQNTNKVKDLPKDPTKESSYDTVKNYSKDINEIKDIISEYTSLERNNLISEKTYDSISGQIRKLAKNLSEKDIDNLTNKTFKMLLDNKDVKYISTAIYNTINNTRKIKINEYREQARNMIDDIVDWKDKKLGLSYQTETMKRNIFDIIPDKQKAQKVYETYFQSISESEAKAKKEINAYNEKIKQLNLNNKESTAVQMYGEYKYNPETNLTGMQVDEFIEKNKLDYDKIKKSVEVFRNTYDELINKVNKVLIEQGYKPIEYRKGYFPHFIEDKPTSIIGKFAEKLGWKIDKKQLPTDIAGMSDMFKPGKTWTAFSQQRKGDATDYNALKGFDTYVRGAADLIYHTENIQKLRALENEIRYQYSSDTVQKQIDSINSDEELDIGEKQEELDKIFEKFNNPMPNFVTELRRYTDGIANKKAIDDRNMEHKLNREVYSTMTNIQNRVNANMVGLNVSSAFTNFIPITQGYSQISTKSMLKAIKSTISNQVRNDGFDSNSTFLTNRLNNPEKLYKTGLDKFNEKASFLFDGIDSVTSNILVRGKYYDNINNGMSEIEAIKNADEFAKDVMAGRSKGEMPTIYNEKNPITKLFTSFQLEVKNQFGYMFKDIPRDLKDKGVNRMISAFFKMYAAAWLYNKFAESLTGRKSAFSPVDIIEESISITSNNNLSTYDKAEKITKNVAQELPFVGGLLGGGRLPISSAIPDIKTFEYLANSFSDDSKKRKTAINNLKTELMKPTMYLVIPVGGGQIKKTYEGLSMYSKNKKVKGSYTTSGQLRFPVKEDILSKSRAAIFGQYASKEARQYFDSGEKPLNEKQIESYKKLNVPITKYWQYRQDLKEIKKIKADKDDNGNSITGSATGKKAYEIITNKNYSTKEKNYLLSEISSSENKETINSLKMLKNNEDAFKYYFSLNNENKKKFKDAIEKYNFTAKELTSFNNSIDKTNATTKKQSIENYLISSNLNDKQIGYLYNKNGYIDNDKLNSLINSNISLKSYIDIKSRISDIKGNISSNGKSISGSKKKKVLSEINSTRDLSKEQKLLITYLEGYTITKGDFTGYTSDLARRQVFDYVNSLKISLDKKREILTSAGYKMLSNGRIGW